MTVPAAEYLDTRIKRLLATAEQLAGLLPRAREAGNSLPSSDELDGIVRRLEPAVAKMLEPVRGELVTLLQLAGSSAADRWNRASQAERQLDQLSAELLPVAEGALARAAGLDNGLCALAQRLLDDLSAMTVPWHRIVIPAAREQTSNRSWVVGLPVLDSSLWDLPLMVHELGHFAATRLEDQYSRRLGEELLDLTSAKGGQPGALSYKHAEELFADVFGAYCAGPAFAASMMARAMPAFAQPAGPSHPTWEVRMYAVLRTLRRLSGLREKVRKNLLWITDLVATDWYAALGAAVGTGVSTALGASIDAFTDEALKVMDLTGSIALFQGEDVLATGELLAVGTPPVGQADIRILLNAAWAERLRDPEKTGTIKLTLDRWRVAGAGLPSAHTSVDGER